MARDRTTRGSAGSGKTPTGSRFALRFSKVRERTSQVGAAYQMTKKADPRLPWILLGAFLVPLVIGVVVGFVIGKPVYLGIIGLFVGLLLAMALFTRRATRSAYAQVEGQVGAGLAVLQSMRGDWRVTPAVSVTGNQDMVHRVVGRPGVVLVAEGTSRRVGALLGQEKKRVGRLVGDIPVYDVVVGNDAGQVTIQKLQQHFTKLPRNISPKEVNALDRRLQALGGMNVPMPKGPLPKNARLPKGAKTRPGR